MQQPPLNYNTFLPDTQNNSLNSTVIHNENLNGTRNLTQQDIQTPSHFINEEIVHTTNYTTKYFTNTPKFNNTKKYKSFTNTGNLTIKPLNLRLLQNIPIWITKHTDP